MTTETGEAGAGRSGMVNERNAEVKMTNGRSVVAIPLADLSASSTTLEMACRGGSLVCTLQQ